MRVFVSSTSEESARYRGAALAVCHRLGLRPVDAAGLPDPAVRRDTLRQCDLFVLLLGAEFGDGPSGTHASYLELEYEWAAARQRPRILAFAVAPATDESVDRFATVLRTRHGLTRVETVPEFRAALLRSLVPYGGDPTEATPVVPAPPAFHAVPPYVGSAPFTGRAEALDTLDAWGRSDDPVLVVESLGGVGKSALTWEWARNHAPGVVDGLHGRLWWSFYGGSASITRFLRETLVYVSGLPRDEVGRLGRTELTDQVLAALRERPYLLVLDGFERLLAAFGRFDPSKLRDEDVESARRSLIEPHADEVIRALCTVEPSKVLVSTRLMPDALAGRYGRPTPGVAHLRLPGLTDADTQALLDRLGTPGDTDAVTAFFRQVENHPLLVGVVAGLARNHPGGLDGWLADPAGGAGAPEGDLSSRRAYLLDVALSATPAPHRQLLGWISVLPGAVDRSTMDAINPFRPANARGWDGSDEDVEARVRLDAALADLEERGLLWWDRSTADNAYDLHPIVRASVHDMLDARERVAANERIRDHFQSLPPEDVASATSIEDLRQTLTLFYALIGAGQLAEASAVWSRALGDPLLMNLGAATTVVDLLEPLAADGSRAVRADLAIAYFLLGQYTVAVAQDTSLLADALVAQDVEAVTRSLGRLAVGLAATGREIAAAWTIDLYAMLRDAAGAPAKEDPWLLGERGIGAIRRGHLDEGLALLDESAAAAAARRTAPPPGFEADLAYWRCMAGLAAGDLSEAEVDAAAAHPGDWRHRRRVAELRAERLLRAQRYADALTAQHDVERVDRDAGRETMPATTAYLLARLDRRDEASEALDDALGRLAALHPAARPHHRIGQALLALDRRDEAIEQALLAYRRAWRDGPPYAAALDLTDARELLTELGVPEPSLEVTDPESVRLPLDRDVRAFVSRCEENAARTG
ncbi:DUF4062 domain-containing protein [Cryptosporangium aurantiacum]|uniref:DUF4062 domain-containing protein n=1 Tax=Cryptosporangium aurantiacum TaxID=134849 RepID=A0A1M7RLL3_9ACTN|nr:DUF4062 domain-containing protein [Cryptosporangium aurantiacum]SHN47144.1 protein of unknown function [Cryptosporangium aurantiacum]